MKPRFLRLDAVLAVHCDQIARYGGLSGVRHLGLLESAVASPEATHSGSYLHGTLLEMAAAYLFHLAQNRPFLDGNKRVAAACAFLFLYLNDLLLDCTEDDLVDLTLGVASGARSKSDAAVFISPHTRPLTDD